MPLPSAQGCFCTRDEDYRGIWWGQTPTGDEYSYKYSGGLATYPVQSAPFAIHSQREGKTFFVYGGTPKDSYLEIATRTTRREYGPGQVLHSVGCFNHRTGRFSAPTILFDKYSADPHDNPVISMDDSGHILVFSPSHGHLTTPSFIHRSTAPGCIDSFETVEIGLFAYPQVWKIEGGTAFFFTQYSKSSVCRAIYHAVWNPHVSTTPVCLASTAKGHYQITGCREDGLIASAFDFHPEEGGLEARTNIYYMQSGDGGDTWTDASGSLLRLPVDRADHPALVRDFQKEGLLVYIKDLYFDPDGNPRILYVTSQGWRPGPESGPHKMEMAAWDGKVWSFETIAPCDNNYDSGIIYRSSKGALCVLATTGPGPQPYNPGGEIELWERERNSKSWQRVHALTSDSLFNHTHPRRVVGAAPEFIALWADGNPRNPSTSQLYYTDALARSARRIA